MTFLTTANASGMNSRAAEREVAALCCPGGGTGAVRADGRMCGACAVPLRAHLRCRFRLSTACRKGIVPTRALNYLRHELPGGRLAGVARLLEKNLLLKRAVG